MLTWLLGAMGAVLAWLAWWLLAELVGAALAHVTAPVRRPLARVTWRLLGEARWPWPALLLVGLGVGAGTVGLRAVRRASDGGAPRWVGTLGILAFLGGVGLALVAPLLWRVARRARVARGPWSMSRAERG